MTAEDPLEMTETDGAYTVTARIQPMGRDLQVNLYGGEPHIGAVGMAEARPSLKDHDRLSATGSVFTFPAHKEDGIAKSMAEGLARRRGGKVVVVAGMHWRDLSPEGIRIVESLCGRLLTRIAKVGEGK
jgi:hypothetical protein